MPNSLSGPDWDADQLREDLFLMFAESGDVSELQALIAQGVDPNTRDAYGQSALLLAAKEGALGTVSLLLRSGAHADAETLAAAVRSGTLEVVLCLLDAGLPVDLSDSNAWTALQTASFAGETALVLALLERGADLEATDSSGMTALMHAATSGHDPVVQILLEAGAQKQRRDQQGLTAVDWARDNGHATTVAILSS